MLPRVVRLDAALAHGLTAEAIRHRLRIGEWSRLALGIYLTVREDPQWLDLATAAVLGTGGVLSYTAAARLHGFDVCPASDPIHVTVPRQAGRQQRQRGLRFHFHDLEPGDAMTRDGIPAPPRCGRRSTVPALSPFRRR